MAGEETRGAAAAAAALSLAAATRAFISATLSWTLLVAGEGEAGGGAVGMGTGGAVFLRQGRGRQKGSFVSGMDALR